MSLSVVGASYTYGVLSGHPWGQLGNHLGRFSPLDTMTYSKARAVQAPPLRRMRTANRYLNVLEMYAWVVNHRLDDLLGADRLIPRKREKYRAIKLRIAQLANDNHCLTAMVAEQRKRLSLRAIGPFPRLLRIALMNGVPCVFRWHRLSGCRPPNQLRVDLEATRDVTADDTDRPPFVFSNEPPVILRTVLGKGDNLLAILLKLRCQRLCPISHAPSPSTRMEVWGQTPALPPHV